MICQITKVGDEYACSICGRPSKFANLKRTCGKAVVSPIPGPGTELTAIFRDLGIRKKPGCGCAAMAKRMNQLGVAGCREQRSKLAAELREKWADWDWQESAAAAMAAVQAGLAWRVMNWFDPFPELIEIACERAETIGKPPSTR